MEEKNYQSPIQIEVPSNQIPKKSNNLNIIFLVIIFAITILFGVGIFILGGTEGSPLKNNITQSPINQQVATTSIPLEESNTGSCPPTVTDIDNNTYNTVQIGTQCWMQENLKVTKNPSGKGITRYCYNNDTSICNTDGGLYDWNTAMNGSAGCNGTGASQPQCTTPVQGICPIGWHIPSHYEWTLLEKNVGSSPDAFVYDETYGKPRGTDEGKNLAVDGSSGFKALPAGSRAIDDKGVVFMLRGKDAEFWSSTVIPVPLVIEKEGVLESALLFGSSNIKLLTIIGDKKFGISIRCLKD